VPLARLFGIEPQARIWIPITMPKITYIDHSGRDYVVEGEVGQTVMETAIKHDVPGIVAECGGACSCATCHVYVDDAWRGVTGEPSQMEEDMLDFAFDVRPESRLSCQLRITDAFDGLIVRIPEHQG
jgi:ferredoxin, 2Fe-2S